MLPVKAAVQLAISWEYIDVRVATTQVGCRWTLGGCPISELLSRLQQTEDAFAVYAGSLSQVSAALLLALRSAESSYESVQGSSWLYIIHFSLNSLDVC